MLVATTTNELFCFGEGDLLQNGSAAKPLWYTSIASNGFPPRTRPGSNMAPPIGISATPVVDTSNRRMFVVAMWQSGSGSGIGNYSIFNISLDTGNITTSQQLVDGGANSRISFNADTVDQRTAINYAGGWLWFGFAAYLAYDAGDYSGWVVAVNPDKLTQQLYQPMISLDSWNGNHNLGSKLTGAGVWGVGGVAAANDGTVFALTGNAGNPPDPYWNYLKANPVSSTQPAGPGNLGDFFQAAVHLGVEISGSGPQLAVNDWFQDSNITRVENMPSSDLDFGGSSPVVLPAINGRQLLAFIPKDGNIFILDSQALGNYSQALTLVKFADILTTHGNDSKAALAFVQTPDGRNILIVGASSSSVSGGVAAFQIDAVVNPPTLTKLWTSPHFLNDSFGSPTVITNPVVDPSNPPDPVGLAWVIDGSQGIPGSFVGSCTMRAYDVLTGNVVYDSDTTHEVTEQIPAFTAITSGGNSVFCPTMTGFMGFTQFVTVPKSLTFIMDRTTFGKDEVDALEPPGTTTANFGSAYWIAVRGFLPSELGLTQSNLNSPPSASLPSVATQLDLTLPGPVSSAISQMLNAATFDGPVIPENSSLPDEPQGYLFPFTVSFTGDKGFQEMISNSISFTLVTLQASMTIGALPVTNSTQIELVTGEDPFFLDVNPLNPKQPTWLSFDIRLFKLTGNTSKFGVLMSSNEADAPGFISDVIQNLNDSNGTVGSDSFEGLTQDENGSALEFHQMDNYGRKVFNFALARVRINGTTGSKTPTPVRVFFRLFQAQNTTSNFNTMTTYRFADEKINGADNKIPLLGVQNDAQGNPEYVTIPCFATARNNLTGPADMHFQQDSPNAQNITVTPGAEAYFGCWLDINQPQQTFLPSSPPTNNWDGPWTQLWAAKQLQSIRDAIVHAPHQCLIAEIRYDDAPVVPNATSATSDKLAQRNIAWIDGPSPVHSKMALVGVTSAGVDQSLRMTHPIQISSTAYDAQVPDELMILWGNVPAASQAQLYLPALNATYITAVANARYPAQRLFKVDEHTIGLDANGVSFVPIPTGSALAAGLLTIDLPASIRRGDQYTITVRQLTEATSTVNQPPPPPPVPESQPSRTKEAVVRAEIAWRRVVGAFQFVINISTEDAILLSEERLLATLRWTILQMSTQNRWQPVLQRYIDYIAGRVQGFGGNPGQILPSPVGAVPGLPFNPNPPGFGDDTEEFIGKVEAIVFNGVGDFKGFIIRTRSEAEHRIFSDEHKVLEVVERAKAKRDIVKVIVGKHHHNLYEIIVF